MKLLFPLRNRLLGNRPIRVEVGNEVFRLVPQGTVAFGIWSRRHFEKKELEFIVNVLRPGMTFFDVGANVGLFSLPAAARVGDRRVFAFEPTTWTYERLVANAKLNGLRNLQAQRCAVGDKVGEALLKVNVAGKEGLNTIGRPTHEDFEMAGTEQVPMTTIDAFVSQECIRRVDVMKIDVEGAELHVLRGAERLLNSADAPLVLYESGFLTKGFDYHPVEMMWLLENHGYGLFVLDRGSGDLHKPADGRAYNATVVAVKPTHPAYTGILERAR